MQRVTHAGTTNQSDGSLVRVVSANPELYWVAPANNATFSIKADATLPEINFNFETTLTGPYQWSWKIEWNAKVSGLRERARRGRAIQTFKEEGTFSSTEKKWSVNLNDMVLGGDLTVTVVVQGKKITRKIIINGTNPESSDVKTYIDSIGDLDGFDKLLEQESHSKHFINFDNNPIVAFDKGYGMTQITTPSPTYEQVWSWKKNIDVGSSLYKDKRDTAKRYLGRNGRAYTEDELEHETFSLWNGGHYYHWDAPHNQWVRKENILCDSETTNVGWDTNNTKNANMTESELRQRDREMYRRAQKDAEHPWVYSGVCYADHILGE